MENWGEKVDKKKVKNATKLCFDWPPTGSLATRQSTASSGPFIVNNENTREGFQAGIKVIANLTANLEENTNIMYVENWGEKSDIEK